MAMSSYPKDLGPSFCVMPWINLATETNGKCKICCIVMTNRYIKREDGSDFEIQTDPIEKIWNSKYVRDIRQKMLAGERISDCFYCHGQEDLGQKSPRQSYNAMWFNEDVHLRAKESLANDGHVAAYPTSLEPRPGILCNLKCNMCWSMSSSKILSERKAAVDGKDADVPEFLKSAWKYEVQAAEASDFNWSDRETYLDNFRKCIPSLKRLYFTGGEPTIIKSNISALEELIAAGRTDLLVSFTTNLSQLKPELIELLKKFERVEITGSIDGIGPVNDYIRYPSKWSTVSDNLKKVHSLYPKIYLSIIYVVQAANIFSYVDLIRWIARTMPERQIQVIPTMLQGPDHLRPNILTASIKQRALEYIDEALFEPDIFDTNKGFLRDIRSQIQTEHPNGPRLRQQFREYVTYLDKIRNTNFAQAIPEMKDLYEVSL